MLPRGLDILECSCGCAGDFTSWPLCRSSAQSCVPPTRRPAAVSSCRTRPHPPPILVHRLLLRPACSAASAAPPPLCATSRNVAAHLLTLYPLDHRVAVVALVGDQVFDTIDVHLRLLVGPLVRFALRSAPPPPSPPRSTSGWSRRPDPRLAASPLPPLLGFILDTGYLSP